MNGSTDPQLASRLLSGLESGTAHPDESYRLALELDPVLLYVIVRFLRDSYPASDPAASAVLDRVLKLTSMSPALVTKMKEGESDPVSEWFASEHGFRDFKGRGDAMLELVVDKLES